jgi:hypothetical protein
MQKNRRRKTWQRRRFTKGGEMSTGKRWWSEKEMMQEMIEKWKQAVADWQIQQELAKEQGGKWTGGKKFAMGVVEKPEPKSKAFPVIDEDENRNLLCTKWLVAKRTPPVFVVV